jgi:hypothetical protein
MFGEWVNAATLSITFLVIFGASKFLGGNGNYFNWQLSILGEARRIAAQRKRVP